MLFDFTTKYYSYLNESLLKQGFHFITFNQYADGKSCPKFIILRHDVDKLPANSLVTAKIEQALGIHGSYYFRAVPESWNENIIKEISAMGHEIGYHYENLSVLSKEKRVKSEAELFALAFDDFKRNLEKLRALAPVTTICMHGSPRSKWDSRDLWKKYDYKSLGLIGEPYFDIDFAKVFYLTDTGRRWDGYKVSIRDKILEYQDQWGEKGLVFHSTQDIIDAANEGRLPHQIMITVHPQRWADRTLPWAKELVWQNAKNLVKKYFLMDRSLPDSYKNSGRK